MSLSRCLGGDHKCFRTDEPTQRAEGHGLLIRRKSHYSGHGAPALWPVAYGSSILESLACCKVETT